MKLYATLSNSAGKEVSLSSNERIEATVYEGNKKQYSVYIEWGDIGDNIDDDGNELPESEKHKGSIVTIKEWRNEPDERRARTHQNIARWLKNGEHDKLREEDYIK